MEKYSLKNKNIVFFDGICNYCNWFIRFLIKNDSKENLRFSSLQSNFAKRVIEDKNLENDLTTIIFIQDEKIFKKSDAIIRIFLFTNSKLKIFGYLIFIFPRFFRNFFYELFAKRRYSIFGKKEKCMAPEKNISHLFIE
jgi:predicted DCC family thiol-disulfide oxidoreductase YuxK